ncbi:TPA: hypothetical protein ACH3X1_001790 [Trebouxia sp. C0004]
MQSMGCVNVLSGPNCTRCAHRSFTSWRPSAISRLQQCRRSIQRREQRSAQPQANLDSGTTLAVTQQCGSFIFTILGEAAFTRSQLPDGAKGRPSVIPTVGAAAAFAATVGLLNAAGPDGAKAGLALGTLTSLALIVLYAKRAVDTEGDPAAWPGPKAWPAALILVSFFSVNICFGALLKALDPVVLDNVPPLNWLSLLSL